MLRMLTLVLILIAAPTWAAQLRVVGTEIVVIDDAGREVRGNAIVGAELDLGQIGSLRVIHTEQDAKARFPDQLWVMDAQLRPLGAADYATFCPPDTLGDSRMLIYSGYLDADLHYVADRERFSLSCVSGVEAKCLRWGYLPWRRAPIGDAPLAPYFETCIRMARADYCGNDQATTRAGTSIDVYDRVGIQQPTPDLPDYAFEAGWGPAGAVCVHHARIPENLTLSELPARCARLTAAQIGASCNEDTALSMGALISNRSIEHH